MAIVLIISGADKVCHSVNKEVIGKVTHTGFDVEVLEFNVREKFNNQNILRNEGYYRSLNND